MDKITFLKELRKKLWFLPKNELDKTILYYSEMISDRMDAGMSEEDAVRAVGNIDDIVDSVKRDSGFEQTAQNVSSAGSIINKIISYIGIAALYFAIFCLVSTAVELVFAVLFCIIAAIVSINGLGIGFLILFLGFTFILSAFFLATIPLCGYCKAGIRYFKKLIRRY